MPNNKKSTGAIGETPALFVLESPNKVNKVQGFLGNIFLVSSSKGHIRTLGANKDLGIDVAHDFAPTFVVDPKKTRVVSDLRSQLRGCDHARIYLATDPDREGEAIAWHIAEVLGVDPLSCLRVTYTSITKAAVEQAVRNPGRLDMAMVHSQQARQILDKLIGYELSPCLWKQFKNVKLSAGRVQSVVVRIITERELEIANFKGTNYYKIQGKFSLAQPALGLDGQNNGASYPFLDTELDAHITNIDEVSNILNMVDSQDGEYNIDSIKKTISQRQPSAPFTTSSLQQEASNRLGMSPTASMQSAQRLYEAGHITYMRTDSTMLSPEAISGCAKYIKSKYGDEYYRMKQYGGKKSKGAQEAHEACRPTHIEKKTISVSGKLNQRDVKLYNLIWKRTIASQMMPAKVEVNTAKIAMGTTSQTTTQHSSIVLNPDKFGSSSKSKYIFVGKYEKVLFDGFMRIYKPTNTDHEGNAMDDTSTEDNASTSGKNTSDGNGNNNSGEDNNNDTGEDNISRLEAIFASLKKGAPLWPLKIDAMEKQQQPPHPRYSEASLIKKLEDLGIGRPSTYASMVEKVQTRNYVEMQTTPAVEKKFAHMEFELGKGITVSEKTAKVDGEKNKLHPTPLGMMINQFLLEKFDRLMDYEFTAKVEEHLDEIATGQKQWHLVVKAVYDYVNPIVITLGASIGNQMGGTRDQRELCLHPKNGFPIKVIQTREGWAICEDHTGGEKNSPHKKDSRWANIGTIHPDSITAEQAVALLDSWPKKLGDINGKPVELYKAKSVYIKFDGQNFSIDMYRDDHNKDNTIGQAPPADPAAMELGVARDIIKYIGAKKLSIEQAKKERHTFEGNNDIAILKGPYGYYIKYLDSINVKLPSKYKKDISAMTKEEAEEAVRKHLDGSKLTVSPNASKGGRGRGSDSDAGKGRGRGRGGSRGGRGGKGRGRGSDKA